MKIELFCEKASLCLCYAESHPFEWLIYYLEWSVFFWFKLFQSFIMDTYVGGPELFYVL